MSLKARKSSILIFLAGAVALGGLMFFYFGGRRLVARHESFRMFFDYTVSGLRSGSLVTFKGVPVGFVQSVILGPQQQPGEQRIPVVAALDLDRLYRQLGVLEDLTDPAVRTALVERGLRAELEIAQGGYVTGGMVVNLEFHKDAPPPRPEENAPDVIPTIASRSLAKIQTIEKIVLWLPSQDFAGDAARISNELDEAATRIQVIPFAEFSRNIVRALRPLSNMDVERVRGDIGNIAANMDALNRQLADTNGQLLGQSAEFLRQTAGVGQSLASFSGVLGEVHDALVDQSPWRRDLEASLDHLSDDLQRVIRQLNALQAQPGILFPPENPPRRGAPGVPSR